MYKTAAVLAVQGKSKERKTKWFHHFPRKGMGTGFGIEKAAISLAGICINKSNASGRPQRC